MRRSRRFIGFTQEGERVLEWAKRILADQDALLQELSEIRDSLHGRLRIGAVPTAVPLISRLTAPFCARHPSASASARSMSSIEIQRSLDNFEIDLGITYLDNEPMLRVKSVPLYRERYCLLVPEAGPFKRRKAITWGEAATLPLCLLSSDMQNRRIIDAAFAAAGHSPTPQIETNSIANLGLHVATGRWSSIVACHVLETLGKPPGARALDLVDPEISHEVGVVVADHEPVSPTAKAMLSVIAELTADALLFEN